jgi:hypothetical protein
MKVMHVGHCTHTSESICAVNSTYRIAATLYSLGNDLLQNISVNTMRKGDDLIIIIIMNDIKELQKTAILGTAQVLGKY